MFKVLAFLVVVAVAGVHAKPSDSYKAAPIPYNFAYDIKDEYAGTDFGHSENSDGSNVKGSYNVQLPDGRKQTVEYVADHHKGFQANVDYKGKAQYPQKSGPAVTFKPSGGGYDPKPKPSYH